MTKPNDTGTTTRRGFLQKSGSLAASATMLGGAVPAVHAAENNTIRLALIGCGGRGRGAVANALRTKDQGPIKLYATGDLEEKNSSLAVRVLSKEFPDQIDVPKERQFLGFDSHKKAIDSLRPGDVAMCTTRSYIRPVHVEYAVKKGINVFMEKEFAPDPMGSHRMLRAAEAAEKNGVKILAGLQCRHSPARHAMVDRINSGAMGELSYIRANRLTGRRWLRKLDRPLEKLVDQYKYCKAHLLWMDSGYMIGMLIHQIDECCWLMDDWPVSCRGMGGREAGSDDRSQNFHTYSMEYTFPNGKKAFCGFRGVLDGHDEFATYVHCSKQAGQFSGNIHKATVHAYKDQRIDSKNIVWTPTPDTKNPWDLEWIAFINSIRNNKPHNEGKRAVMANYAALMGRAAVHYNNIVTWDEVVNSKFQFCDYLDDLSYDSPAPVQPDENGFFPAPIAGKWKEL